MVHMRGQWIVVLIYILDKHARTHRFTYLSRLFKQVPACVSVCVFVCPRLSRFLCYLLRSVLPVNTAAAAAARPQHVRYR